MDLQSISPSTASSHLETGLPPNARLNLNLEQPQQGNPADGQFRESTDISRRHSTSDFAQQIRQLEIEGNKLRASSASVFEISASGLSPLNSGNGTSETSKGLSTNLSSLTSLVDICSEQKTIAELRVQLDQQQKETEQLQSYLLHDGTSAGRGFVTVSPPGRSAFSTVSEPPSTRVLCEFDPPSHLERALKDSQEQVAHLRKKLYEANEKADSQKRQFRVNIEELRAKLHETIVNRDTILELRQKEAVSHETLISKLQSTVQELHEKYQTIDRALIEATKKLDVCSESKCTMETTLGEIQTILSEKEKKHGKAYFDCDPICQQKCSILPLTLKRCLELMEGDLEAKKIKLSAMEEELSVLKLSTSEKERLLTQVHQETLKRESEDATKRVSQLSSDLEQQLDAANERAKNARAQASALQSQMNMLESQHAQQTKLKEDTISEMETKISQLKADYNQDRAQWQQTRETLEADLDETRRELTSIRSERDQFSHKSVSMETSNEHLQSSVSHLQMELERERERNTQHREREETLHTKLMAAELELSHKQQDVDRLEKMLEVVKQECSNQIKEMVGTAEKLERDRYTEQLNSLQSQLTSMTEKFHKVTAELDLIRSESEKLKQQLQAVTQELDSAKSQLQSAVTEKQQLSQTVTDLKRDVDRLGKERDYYFGQVDEKNEVLSQVASHKERLNAQLEEKTLNLLTLKQQSENISQLVEVNSRTNENIREEKERILALLTEKTVALKEMEVLHDNLSKKLKIREKRIAEAEEERQRLVADLGMRNEQVNVLLQEKEKLYEELKESRLEVAGVTASRSSMKEEIFKQKNYYETEITRLQAKLKSAENDLILAQKTIRSKHCLDNKAVRYADKMQKEITNKRSEVDSLQSKLRKLDDKVDMLLKEKSMIQKDKDQLKKALMKSINNCEQLSEELQTCLSKNNKLQENVGQLEAAVEKAMMGTATRAQLEGFEQEMARVKINHQLDLKEAEQNAQTRSLHIAQPSSSSPVQQARLPRQPVDEDGGANTVRSRQAAEVTRTVTSCDAHRSKPVTETGNKSKNVSHLQNILHNATLTNLKCQTLAAIHRMHHLPHVTEFTDYVTTAWVDDDSLFKVAMWNQHGNIGPRTNNHLEGWHSKRNRSLTNAHPNIYEFINKLKTLKRKPEGH
ncbi:coiled-coil domain-containing protein 158-like [Gigantopelta aegis]|uniref:coiled-coil domain-containing protein 158-like n=1 Tax=Gigantopelta aegis TaxID=1735272 RepID=UPI001B888FD1|nr:coiled-coil domain-containing protein 158-like [Gigantopelta aegis]